MTDLGVPPDNRTRIIEVAARLLREQGPAAVTTRGVAQEAGVQAPAIYRLFQDKDGLLEAVAEHVMATHVAMKAAVVDEAEAANTDPVEDLRAGWRTQVDFGLTNPALFRLLSDPARVANSPAAGMGKAVLEARIHRVAVAGRLKVSERRAVELFQAAGVGVVTTLLTAPAGQRDAGLAEAALDGVLAQIITDEREITDTGPATTTIAFRAIAHALPGLSASERGLLSEWLDRVITAYEAS
ncbi:TetR/AcrR family transcriptional regulator [Amnibacterium flavum]|uniref:TetR family transcriptional regulator n=1 Tax=Amnibacterium flavum TaxID=2173173 RepID=A0A2V1HYL3_9MICO|nr:TetR/AcrR family transcriptional regulator [Amnibacterium flavum]PVZ95614.1 TetR family transcriptional regulator [Amnibacterium flavum]